MDGNTLATAAQWVATACVAGGLAYTWKRNGDKQKASDTKLKTELTMELKGIKDKLDDPVDGLKAIKQEISGMKEHCASVTAGFGERITHTEQDLHRLEK